MKPNGESKLNPVIRVIDQDGTNLGLVEIPDAEALAHEKGLDLVEVGKDGDLIVGKIIDYAKLQYRKKKDTKKPKRVEQKEIRLGAYIGDHDLNFKVKAINRFLGEGKPVKVSVRFRDGIKRGILEIGENLLSRVREMTGGGIVRKSMREVGSFFDMYTPERKA